MLKYCVALILLFVMLHRQCIACDIDADRLVNVNTRLNDFKIWSAPTTDLASCAKACVRVKICISFNYDLSTRLCDLNSESSTDHPEFMTHAPRILHSNIVEWPATVISSLLSYLLVQSILKLLSYLLVHNQ